MKKGFKFLNDLGQTFEVVSVSCKIRKSDGDTFTFNAETIQHLIDSNVITPIDDEEETAC